MNTSAGDLEAPDAAGDATNTSEPIVAVLPFSNLSGDPEQDYFCEGIAAEIIIALSRIPGLHLVARSAIFAFTHAEDPLDVCELGRSLGATDVLRGALRRWDDQLSIQVDLIGVATGADRWSCRFDRPIQDVLVVLDEIVAGITRTIGVHLPSYLARKIQRIHTSDIEAYEQYLRGRRLYYQFSRPSVEAALAAFEKALAIDDAYALAYCGLADCYAYRYMYVESNQKHLRQAEAAGRRALELDALLAEAHASRGMVLSLSGRFKAASEAFERAIELDPQLFEARFLYARVCFAHGALLKAARLFEEAHRARPEDYQSLMLAGQVYDDLGEKARARALRRQGVKTARRHLSLHPDETRALYMGANGLVMLGETEEGLAWLQRALDQDPDEPMLLYNAGCIFAVVGETERSLDCLERSVEQGLRQKGWFEHDSNLDVVRDHARYRALLEELV